MRKFARLVPVGWALSGRAKASLLITERGAKTVQVKMDVNIRLGDIRGCKEELSTELQKNEETNHLEETLRHLDYACSLQVYIYFTNNTAGRM